MVARDPHRFINDLEHSAIERIIDRLESRSKDAVFTRLFDKYVTHLNLTSPAQILEVGCGTGAMSRILAKRSDFSGKLIGVDQSLPFIEAAKRFAEEENVSDRIEFQVGDSHSLDFAAATFDSVIAHTVISHVTDPIKVIKEMVRVVRPGGIVAIFDGDYASLTYGFPDHDFGHKMDESLVNATFNNPLIMRDLPRILSEFELEMVDAWGDAVTEIGNGSYFRSFAETYAPAVTSSGLLPKEKVDAWFKAQINYMENGTFFASCNYYTYLLRRT